MGDRKLFEEVDPLTGFGEVVRGGTAHNAAANNQNICHGIILYIASCEIGIL
jgi:hypothetical protein